MRAVDTNIVVRYPTNDNPPQAATARAVFKAGDTFVSTTVLLESEWVLRSVYNLSPHEITTALRALAALPGVSVERPSLLAEALDLVDRGWTSPTLCIWAQQRTATPSSPLTSTSSRLRRKARFGSRCHDPQAEYRFRRSGSPSCPVTRPSVHLHDDAWGMIDGMRRTTEQTAASGS